MSQKVRRQSKNRPTLVPEGITPQSILSSIERAENKPGSDFNPEPAEPLTPPTLPSDPTSNNPIEMMVKHIIAHTTVGREVPNFTNRAFIMPTCYVPRGSDSLEEVERRYKGGDYSGNKVTAVAEDSHTLSVDGNVSSSSVTQPPTTRITSKAFAAEEGIQFDTLNAFMCPFMVHQRVSAKGFLNAKPAAGQAADEADYEHNPATVMVNMHKKAQALAQKANIEVVSTCHGTTTFAIEQALMRHSARPVLDMPQALTEFLFVDCDVRMGTVAVFPKTVVQAPTKHLSEEQLSYVSRFQLLGSSDNHAEGTPSVHVATNLVVGAFDPYFSTPKYQSLHQTLKKMSSSKIDRAAEAVHLRSKVPIYQITFQSRSDNGVLVLESHDNGKTWFEIKSQHVLGSITTPIVNTQKHALEAVFTAKHMSKCTQLMNEWASFYLKHTFVTGSGKEASNSSKGQASNKIQQSEEISEIGFVHPTSQLQAQEYDHLRQSWQLVCVEKISVQAAQCAESKKNLSNLAQSVESNSLLDDEAFASSLREGEAVSGNCKESSLIVWLWHHTKTLFADDGVGFLRGATTFRRRVSVSNEHILRERGGLWSDSSPKAINRFATAIQSVFNECSSVVGLKFADLLASPDTINSLAGDVPLYLFTKDNANGQLQKCVSLPTDAVASQAPIETEPSPAQSLVESQSTVQMSTAISVREHGTFLQKLADATALPIVDLAKSFAFHAYIPWSVVHYPLSLNTFTDMQLPMNIKDAERTDASFNPSVTEGTLPTFALRAGGAIGILKSTDPLKSDLRLTSSSPLGFTKDELNKIAVEEEVTNGIRKLLSSSFDTKTPADATAANAAPVFAASFGHRDWASFDCQNVLSEVLFRMLGKSTKTAVSALCFSDHPSSALRGLDAATAEHVNATHTPLGTRSITSVYLDSKDASRSQVTNLGKQFKTPGVQEHGVRVILQRMLAPISLEKAQVLVQSVGGTDKEPARELVAEGTEEPSLASQPFVYKVSVLPEEALDVFRPVAQAAVSEADATNLSELAGRLSAMDALFSAAPEGDSDDKVSAKEALKEMIRTSVSVSQVILENSKPTSIAQLLESKVKGDSTFAYLPQLLEATANGAGFGLGDTRGEKQLRKLLHRGLSRVVFAEDKYFVSEGVQGSRHRSEPIPTTYVIHRTLHDVSVGSDGIARYEKANFVFFTLRDPNIITSAKGNPQRVQEMLKAARHDATKPEAAVPNSTTSRDVPLIQDVFSILYNFGRWGVDSQFSANTKRDTLQLEARTSRGESVHHVLQGWLQSALSQQSADILAMVQGDERLARNPLVHVLVDASNKCSSEIQNLCRNELLHWVSGLSEVAGIISLRELEHSYLTMDIRKVFRKSGIPSELIPHIFHPKPEHESQEDQPLTERDINPFLRKLPCDSFCRLVPQLVVDFGTNVVVPVTIPKTLHTSDGMPVPEGSVAFVGHASADLITQCNSYFGEMAPIHQLGDLLVIPATQDIDASLAVELSAPQDTVWQSSLEMQFGRMKTIAGEGVLMKRHRHSQFVPPTTIERSFVQSGQRYTVPLVGAPLYKKGKLVTFYKGNGAHEFVSRVLQSANLRQVVSYLTK